LWYWRNHDGNDKLRREKIRTNGLLGVFGSLKDNRARTFRPAIRAYIDVSADDVASGTE
jgi:hypothetical protein